MTQNLQPEPRKDGGPGTQREPSLPSAVYIFTQQFKFMLDSGIPVLRSLRTLELGEANQRLKEALKQIGDLLEKGWTISEAMAGFPDAFSADYLKLIEAGEAGGCLDLILDSLVDKMDWEAQIEGKNPPEYTTRAAQKFAHTLGILLAAGTPILKAVKTAAVGHDAEFREAVNGVHDEIRKGDSVANGMRKYPKVFDPVFISFVEVGEETGDLDKTLISFARRSPPVM